MNSAFIKSFLFSLFFSFVSFASELPNILWLTCEDTGPHLGCYGDTYSKTPNLDKLASKGVHYKVVWSTAPVCAPARTAIITGVYPSSLGAEHMRSIVSMPSFMKMYPQFLREVGYYCSNNNKEDYNVEKSGRVWDDSSGKAHWKNRKPSQPFFAIFNYLMTHESQIRTRPFQLKHDPSKVRVPAYNPDTTEVRYDWAQYYDRITEMDTRAGAALSEIEQAGLTEDTIVFFYGDHGSGMPRNKRYVYDSGLHVGLIVYIPEKYRHLAPPDYKAGGISDRLISFVDLAPTVLSIAGIKPPDWMEGRAFMGKYIQPPPKYLFGLRGRMDERYDLSRSVRNERYVYIRNYMPFLIYGEHVSYMFETPTTRIWKKLYDEGKLTPPKTYFWEPKPPEELYDLENDRDEVNNLANSPAHKEILSDLRSALNTHILQTRDTGFLPEADMHARAQGTTIYEMAHSKDKYPLEKILDVVDRASNLRMEETNFLIKSLDDDDPAVRYWAALGLFMRKESGVAQGEQKLVKLLNDKSPTVRIASAYCLAQFGENPQNAKALTTLKELSDPSKNGFFVSILALNVIDNLGKKAEGLKEYLKTIPIEDKSAPQRLKSNIPKLLSHLLSTNIVSE